MKNKLILLVFVVIIIVSCNIKEKEKTTIVTDDITNFWKAYDAIQITQDTVLQKAYLSTLFFNKATDGLKAIMKTKNYKEQDYYTAIKKYPKFWESVRENTLRANEFGKELDEGVEKLKEIYPKLTPAKIYFTMSPLRSNGTTLNDLVLIGSELAMTDENTISEELPEIIRKNRRFFFDSNPIENLVQLNVHEYVHTQQKMAEDYLLSYVIREGVAEFISVIALGKPSTVPAIAYGEKNKRVREKFEEDMFKGNNINQWLWSDAPNEFGVRDLGYYIGYAMCKKYYEQSENKSEAIQELIELDYSNTTAIENFVNVSGYFSDTLENLYQKFENSRPFVTNIQPFKNKNEEVDYKVNKLTIEFSEPMNQQYRNFDFGPLGKEAAIQIQKVIGFSEDGTSITVEIAPLQPNKRYQLVIGTRFKSLKNMPLKSYLIDFKTNK
ncbi:DUF2268 domain-containing putative Zn-dependent protease [Tenacibaculum sp. M341]|uniref:DUF2268 domain-containing putative Zn-dependent protease n=1 Tax=Tenacibaculum sp. M341 TaxID=2530339 RepID=UPI001044805F|nr:DUF2268 domain-containing putative Zn-dependent protease [Tenacibaculum sp. M341]TCI85334.1 hypothetical protein EYW44_17325 [Tenacibaculum sp. M341]